MVRIIDRRFDSKKKSTVNRQRFMRRFKHQIRRAVSDAIEGRSIKDLDSGEQISIPAKDLSEPSFHQGREGVWEQVFSGNDRFTAGDAIERPMGGEGGGGGNKASNEGEGEDDFVFQLSREEFLDLFFEDLALPNLVRTQLTKITEFKSRRAGFTSTGVPSNINVVRSLRGALGRRMALGGPMARRIREINEELEELEKDESTNLQRIKALREERSTLRVRQDAIPFIDQFDLRFNNRVKEPQPVTQAVMFCLMDVSGSMDEYKKSTAKRFFMLLYLFLKRNYEHIEVVFIRHHTIAKEVDEQDFFYSRESGGTVVSSALRMMTDIVKERYSPSQWNIYGAQASDGDNWDNDSPICHQILDTELLQLVRYFAYIEITTGEPQNLWRVYQNLEASHGNFAMQRIESLEDIYPVFRELFKKEPA